jgi:hypothetical protein
VLQHVSCTVNRGSAVAHASPRSDGSPPVSDFALCATTVCLLCLGTVGCGSKLAERTATSDSVDPPYAIADRRETTPPASGIEDSSPLDVVPAEVSLRGIPAGVDHVIVAFAVRNNGTEPLTLGAAFTTGQFAEEWQVVLPGESRQYHFRFRLPPGWQSPVRKPIFVRVKERPMVRVFLRVER